MEETRQVGEMREKRGRGMGRRRGRWRGQVRKVWWGYLALINVTLPCVLTPLPDNDGSLSLSHGFIIFFFK